MNWLYIAAKDYEIYKDAERIRQYVLKEKITPLEFTDITGAAY